MLPLFQSFIPQILTENLLYARPISILGMRVTAANKTGLSLVRLILCEQHCGFFSGACTTLGVLSSPS